MAGPATTDAQYRLKVYWANGTTSEFDFEAKPERTTTADGQVLVYELPDGGDKVEVALQQTLATRLWELAS